MAYRGQHQSMYRNIFTFAGNVYSSNVGYEDFSIFFTFYKIYIDDAFKLTIDKIFQPLNSVDDFKKHLNEDQKEKPDPIKVTYPMKGKDDEENLWYYLFICYLLV